MVASELLDVINTYNRYYGLLLEKRGQLKCTFEHGRIAVEMNRASDDNEIVIRSKHGILGSAQLFSTDPEHWSNSGTFIGRTVRGTWNNHNNLVLNNSSKCKYQHDLVIGVGYGAGSTQFDDIHQVQSLSDLESIIFQQSLVSDFSEEYGIACLHKAGLIPLNVLTFNIRLTSHLGSTDETLLGLCDELKKYMHYVR